MTSVLDLVSIPADDNSFDGITIHSQAIYLVEHRRFKTGATQAYTY